MEMPSRSRDDPKFRVIMDFFRTYINIIFSIAFIYEQTVFDVQSVWVIYKPDNILIFYDEGISAVYAYNLSLFV